MSRFAGVICAIGLAGTVSGCLGLQGGQPTAVAALPPPATSPSPAPSVGGPSQSGAPNSSAATWQMPWQITPIAFAGARHKERIAEAIVPGTGRVRGTPAALKTIGQPLVPVGGENRTAPACRTKVTQEASKFGAKEVEAVSIGAESYQGGVFSGPVRVRITYGNNGKFEVRESVLTCITSPSGQLIDAYVSSSKLRNV